MGSERLQSFISKIIFDLRSNLFIQFSAVSFIIMLILGIIMSVVVSTQLNHNIELLELHNITMMQSMGMSMDDGEQTNDMTDMSMEDGEQTNEMVDMSMDDEQDNDMTDMSMDDGEQINEMADMSMDDEQDNDMTDMSMDDGEPSSENIVNVTIADIQENVRFLQNFTAGLVAMIFVLLYASLFELVRRNWLTVLAQRKDIVEARDRALEATYAKSTFLSNMSHELRTPLNAIIGYSELLEEEAEDFGHEDMIPDLTKIRTAGHHLLSLINDILDISKIEAGKMELYLEKFNLLELVDEIQVTIEPLIHKKNNLLDIDKSAISREIMFADMTKIRQIVFNLLSNASKFTENGQITIALHQEIKENRDWLEIRISDTGIGMTEAQLAQVFTEFQQADVSTTRKFGGTGLGLTISRHFATMMGGDLQAASELGSGSTFTLSLPYTVVDSKRRTAEIPTLSKQTDQVGATILVIDDDPVARDLLKRTLFGEGFHVETANNGEQGLELAQQLHPDLITLDILMPEMDGWTVLSHLKVHPELQHIPVVIISMLDEKNRGFTLGASEFMTKPVDRRKLLDTVGKFASIKSETISGTVLIIEDDEEIRLMMKYTLEREGWSVLEAENGRIGLKVIATQIPDLILLDLMMPEMDGFTFLSELRVKDAWHKIPVVVLTAKDLSLDEHQRLSTSVETVFQKATFEQKELLQQIKNTIIERIEATKR